MKEKFLLQLISYSTLLILAFAPHIYSDKGKQEETKKHDDNHKRFQYSRTRIIKTKYGQVQGRIRNIEFRESVDLNLPSVEVYHGIRYATPPALF